MKRKSLKILIAGLTMTVMAGLFAGCGSTNTSSNTKDDNKQAVENKLSGEIRIDGSSTVFPISEAVAEEFAAIHPDVRIPIGVSGTGGGFKKFTVKETDISNASRPIKDKEKAKAQENGVEYAELTVAYDGLSVVVNKENTWVDSLTVEELNKMWAPDSTVKTWKDVRAEWPDEEIKFYAPGTDSGTFDYFTEEINGEGGAIRSDITPSEDDNVLVQGIAGGKYAIGFFGYAYYEANKATLKVVKIDGGNGAVEPTFETIKSGEYSPLSRPLFIYVSKEALNRAEVKEYVNFYLTDGTAVIPEVGYVALPEAEYEKQLDKIK